MAFLQGYRTEFTAFLFTVIVAGLIFTDRLSVEIGLGLITTQLAPLFAAARATRASEKAEGTL